MNFRATMVLVPLACVHATTSINDTSGLDIDNPVATFGRPTAVAAGQFQFSARYDF